MDTTQNNVKTQWLNDTKYVIERHITIARKAVEDSKLSKDFPHSFLKIAGMQLDRAEVLVDQLEKNI